jgi:hypothetical protein
MSLPTTLIVPNNLVAGTDALAADLNGNNAYITGALNTTNTAVNANTDEIVAARSGETSLDVRIDSIAATANAALPASYLDTDGTLVGNSDVKVPSQKAVKMYTDANSVADRAFSVQRSNHTGTQAQSTIDNLITDLASKVGANNAALTGIPTAPTAVSGTNTTQIATTEFVQHAAFNASLPSQTGNAGKFVTTDGTNASWDDVPKVEIITYDNRATLRGMTPDNGSQIIVDGLGMFVFSTTSTEPDDDETCFATATGRWLLECPNWNYIEAQIPVNNDVYMYLKVPNTITTVAAVSVATIDAVVYGVTPGMPVLVTPPGALDGRITVTGYVANYGTVRIAVGNPSAGTSATLPTGNWVITIFNN